MGSEPETERLLRDRYHLGEELGRGGMGRVWKAHDDDLNRTVAVKEILFGPGLDDDERARAAARARREAQAAAMGSHPNIVTVHDIFEEDGSPWIVMEFLTGRPLDDLVRHEGPRDPATVAKWGIDLLSALDTAHSQGITHRDVKPENVMVTDSGRVVLTDFGIATIADTAAVTQTAGVIGSPAYLAPERLALEPATPASDLWSLGATLYHAATGVSPFRREGVPATLNAILTQEPAQRLRSVPLDQAVRGLLAKDPGRRLDSQGCRDLLTAAARGHGPAPAARASVPASSSGPPGAPTAAPADPSHPSGPSTPGTIASPSGPQAAPLAPAGPPPPRTPTGSGPPVPPPANPPDHDTTRWIPRSAGYIPPRSGPAHPVPTPPEPPSSPGASETGPSSHGGRLSWPVVVLALGLAFLVAGASLVVLMDPWGEPGGTVLSGEDPAAPGASAQESEEPQTTAPGTDPTAGPSPTDAETPEEAEQDTGEPSAPGMTWSRDANGFSVLVPEGWDRSVEGSSVYYRRPDTNTYLQIDSTAHPTDDEYEHVRIQDEGAPERMGNYRLVAMEDVTDQTDFHSAADWEFTWTDDVEDRHVLARNIAVSPGVHYTVVWACPDGIWADHREMGLAALDSFAPA
ncbi:serine/threonine-protein kinase [Nocardiopsis sp. CC223A]|uniref:serine/threonine-protein kinase n=1 Tax=Nocardiopsis sp. CC223A TaxID=3044051 RepID=UPI00278C10D5|nr:serine/threonine-protein kinase [Nocardiopsis sp. CC223A]